MAPSLCLLSPTKQTDNTCKMASQDLDLDETRSRRTRRASLWHSRASSAPKFRSSFVFDVCASGCCFFVKNRPQSSRPPETAARCCAAPHLHETGWYAHSLRTRRQNWSKSVRKWSTSVRCRKDPHVVKFRAKLARARMKLSTFGQGRSRLGRTSSGRLRPNSRDVHRSWPD